MRITHLIRKHASLLALLACLAGVVAAPYLIPENPDSQAFRNGTFGALLLFACYFPLQQAFSKANLRTLICAAGFGLLLSFALSLAGGICLWSGLSEVMARSGAANRLSKLLRPVLSRLFPLCLDRYNGPSETGLDT